MEMHLPWNSIRGEKTRAHHFPAAVNDSSVFSPQSSSKLASLRDWVFGRKSLDHKARGKWDQHVSACPLEFSAAL